jgi:hypothetical protein
VAELTANHEDQNVFLSLANAACFSLALSTRQSIA